MFFKKSLPTKPCRVWFYSETAGKKIENGWFDPTEGTKGVFANLDNNMEWEFAVHVKDWGYL